MASNAVTQSQYSGTLKPGQSIDGHKPEDIQNFWTVDANPAQANGSAGNAIGFPVRANQTAKTPGGQGLPSPAQPPDGRVTSLPPVIPADEGSHPAGGDPSLVYSCAYENVVQQEPAAFSYGLKNPLTTTYDIGVVGTLTVDEINGPGFGVAYRPQPNGRGNNYVSGMALKLAVSFPAVTAALANQRTYDVAAGQEEMLCVFADQGTVFIGTTHGVLYKSRGDSGFSRILRGKPINFIGITKNPAYGGIATAFNSSIDISKQLIFASVNGYIGFAQRHVFPLRINRVENNLHYPIKNILSDGYASVLLLNNGDLLFLEAKPIGPGIGNKVVTKYKSFVRVAKFGRIAA